MPGKYKVTKNLRYKIAKLTMCTMSYSVKPWLLHNIGSVDRWSDIDNYLNIRVQNLHPRQHYNSNLFCIYMYICI
jgi:hypothetical protein